LKYKEVYLTFFFIFIMCDRMNKKIGVVFPLLMFCLFFPPVHALYASWNGYVYINDSLASSGTRVSAHVNNASTATAVTSTGAVKTLLNNQSYYIIDLECASGSNVSFKVWDVWSNVVDQTCTGGWHTNGTSYFNLSISTLANGNNCTYADSCNSGYCVDGYCCNSACDGASEDCNVSGSEGTCTSTAGATTTSPGGGGEGESEGEGETTTTAAETTAETTQPTTAETTVPTCGIEGETCGKDYPECCEGLTCKKKVCTPKKEKPVLPLEIPALGSWMVIGIAGGVISVVIIIIVILARRPPTPPPIPPLPP